MLLPRSIGQSDSRAAGEAIRTRSNSLICKDLDLGHKSTVEVQERHLSPAGQITFTVHGDKTHAMVIKFRLFLDSVHLSAEDVSLRFWQHRRQTHLCPRLLPMLVMEGLMLLDTTEKDFTLVTSCLLIEHHKAICYQENALLLQALLVAVDYLLPLRWMYFTWH